VAVTVTVEVPTIAVLSAVNVKVELPLPGAAMEVGLNAAVTPVGSPETDSATAELKPPLIDVERLVLLEPPCVTNTLAGDAASAKSGAAAASTVNETVVV
jgi:hypothetical protein